MCQRLSSWSDLNSFEDLVEGYGERHGFHASGQGAMQPWREAWIGLRFGRKLNADKIKLGADPPDFELSLGGRVRVFELAEIHPTSRRLGDEYNRLASIVENGGRLQPEPFDIGQEILEACNQLTEVVRKKAGKSYAPEIELALSINAWVHSQEDWDLLFRHLGPALREGLAAFARIEVLFGERLLSLS